MAQNNIIINSNRECKYVQEKGNAILTNGEYVQKKGNAILVTNNCPYKCGGCTQLCPIIEKKFNIELSQLENNINILIKHHSLIRLFGGDPLVHPEWGKILNLLDKFNCSFEVHTRLKNNNLNFNNVTYVNLEHKTHYVPTLIAPIDIIGIKDKRYYWNIAQNKCPMWKNIGCSSLVYNNNAYFCQVAASLDWHLNNGSQKLGWKIESDNPFLKTEEDIDLQAINSCYRCGICFGYNSKELGLQPVNEKSWISDTNFKHIKNNVYYRKTFL